MRKIHIQTLAKQDLKNIWIYSFKNWGADQADCYFEELNVAFALIAENPELGFACDYIREGYRQFHINRHLIFYRVTATPLTPVPPRLSSHFQARRKKDAMRPWPPEKA